LLKEAWSLAIETLSWMQMQNLSERLALARTMKQLGVTDYNAARLAHSLVVETIRRRNFIDRFINNAIRPDAIDEYSLGLQAFLRLYVYQTGVARSWEKIDLKEAENIAGLGRVILGWKTLQIAEPVLGTLLTQNPTTLYADTSDEQRIALRIFHPLWFVRYCFRLFGRPETITMLEADMQQPPTYIRLNTLKADQNEILLKLAEEGVKTEKVEGLKHAHSVTASKRPLVSTTPFQKGLFYIQDKASCFAAEAANPKPGMTVLDICAAPGAKTTYLAQLMNNEGTVYSIDYSKRRMIDWKREVAHMGVMIAEPVVADARRSLPFKLEADVVVLDPPCTSTGTFRKLPSAKWRIRPSSIDKMAEIQRQMLDKSAESVKAEGTLVYSTCSITVEENEMIIERFLKQHPEFSLAEIMPKIGLPGLRGLDKCQRLYSHIHQCNGFFIAKLSKSEP
jgi:16S rRNA (cytosine967-C5)-methyltransferase